MDIYSQNILDHYKNPRNFGEIESPDVTHAETNYTCGDSIEVDLKFKKDALSDIRFRGEGCAISQSAASILTEYIKGKALQEILRLTFDDMQGILGISITERRMKCSILGLFAVQNGILLHQRKELKKWSDF